MVRIEFFAIMILSVTPLRMGDPFRMLDEALASIQDNQLPAREYTPALTKNTYITYEDPNALLRITRDNASQKMQKLCDNMRTLLVAKNHY